MSGSGASGPGPGPVDAGAIAAAQTAATAALTAATTAASGLTAEANTARAAEGTLTTNLAAEITARTTGDTANANAITAEITARGTAITAEALARAAGDALAQQGVATIAALRANTSLTTPQRVLAYSTTIGTGGGQFAINTSDTTSADDNGMIIVDAGGNRWYRTLEGMGWVSILFYGASPSASSLANRQAAQAASIYLFNQGGGVLYIPPGRYNWNVAQPVILSSNMALVGNAASSIIVPDMTTVVDVTPIQAAGLACEGVFTTGNPVTQLAPVILTGTFNGTAGSYVNPATVLTNIVVDGIRIECSYSGPDFTLKECLEGFRLLYVHGCVVQNCTVRGLINTGIEVDYGRNVRISNNLVETCGYYSPYPQSCNGISANGWLDASDPSQSSVGLIVEGNTCNYNRDEGISVAQWGGTTIVGNTLNGNQGMQIEGNAEFRDLPTAATFNQAVPGDRTITGNTIDGLIPSWVPYQVSAGAHGSGTGDQVGISVSDGNGLRINVSGNTIKNIGIAGFVAQGAFAILISESAGGEVTIEDNIIDNIQTDESTGSTPGAICCQPGEKILISGNSIRNCSVYTTAIEVEAYESALDITIEGNVADSVYRLVRIGIGVTNPGGVTPLNPTAGAILPGIVISDNRVINCQEEFVRIEFYASQTIQVLRISNNVLQNGNTGGLSGGIGHSPVALLVYVSSSTLTPVINELWITGNEFSAQLAYTYLFGKGYNTSLPVGSVLKAVIRNNSLGAFFTASPPYFDTPGICSKLEDAANGIGGQNEQTGTAPPTTGTYAVGDRVWNTAPTAGSYVGWACIAAGSPGTWMGFLTVGALWALNLGYMQNSGYFGCVF